MTLDVCKCQMKEMLTLYGLMNKLFYESCHLFLFLILSMIRLMFNFCFVLCLYLLKEKKRVFYRIFSRLFLFSISYFFITCLERVYTWSTFIISIFEVEIKELSIVLDDWVFH